MDIQFTAESSLTLAHNVTGYVTKAEKCGMQEVGRRSMLTVAFIASCGRLGSGPYVPESAASLRPVTYSLVTISLKNKRL